ncbi:MAG: hypothetical protein GC154_16650 [bacterium]|nr:hypothetical protein [bacterium]
MSRMFFINLLISACALTAGAEVIQVSPRPLDGVENQTRTIQEAAGRAQAGDTILIHSGIYREHVVIKNSGSANQPIRLQAAPGAWVVLTGADRLTEWRKTDEAENVYSTDWPYEFISWNENHTHPGDEYHRLIGRCEQVFIDNYPLQQTLEKDRLGRGEFYADLANHTLYVRPKGDEDLTQDKHLVEASTRGEILSCEGDFIAIGGLRFRFAANMAQHGAVKLAGAGLLVENCIFEWCNSSGAEFLGEDMTVKNCTFQYNGQLGFGANRAHRLHFTGCTVQQNNIKGFNRGWEAGGDKICFTRGAVIEHSVFIGNRGNGIWFDIGNEDNTVRNCLIANNEDAGIFYEISYGLHAHDNVITGNGFAYNPGGWGAQSGVSLSSSPGCIIERNLLVGNKEGFNFREQTRSTPRIDDKTGAAVWNHDQIVRSNIIAYNRDAQTWGWFDISDERHWPRAMQENKTDGASAKDDRASEYKDRDATKHPVGLSLEDLKIRFENNVYARLPGQELFNWGVTWKRNKRYASLDEVQQELNLERNSILSELDFSGDHAWDFRLPADSPVWAMEAYPRGEVPRVMLGKR